MWRCLQVLLAVIILAARGQDPTPEPLTAEQVVAAEQRVSQQVRAVLEHYKQPDPVGVPGAQVPDPFPVPDMTKSVAMATMYMKDLRVYGLSRFRVDYIKSDLGKMEMSAAVRIEKMHIVGRYTMRYFLTRSQGLFNITLDDVYTRGTAKMTVVRHGQLQAENIDMDIAFSNMDMHIENAALSSFVKGLISSMAPFIFEGVKPFILKEINQNIRGDINKQVAKLPHMFPNSISPLDYLISDARRLVQFMGYDPYKLPDYNYTTGITTVKLSHIWLTGLASFYRVGNMTLGFEKHVMHGGVHVGTLKLGGRCHWELNLGGFVSRAGAAQFSVDYLQVYAQISQPLDTRQHPKLDTFDVKLGDFEVRVDGTGTFDYIIEIVANVLPNLLRYQIMSTIETKVTTSLQDALDRVDIEEMIEERLAQLDQMTEN